MQTAREIRDDFLNFFRDRGHAIVPSDSLIPANDPTLLFTNAGMNQFKDVFLGTGSRPYVRAADTQKCLRVSGKHNDLEEVGYSRRHHTLFEMLGNWSFGDYFKKEAIAWAWELLTDVWGLPKDRLYATVFEGDAKDGVPPDDEAAHLWATVTDIDPTHIVRFGKKDNFWEMGETGPCGPCSEIHIDLSDEGNMSHEVNGDCPEVIEIWNLVFIQFNRRGDGSLEPLPAKHVDTGMGFERICAVLQGKRWTYDTDLFTPVLAKTGELCGLDYATGDETEVRVPMRVIADHIRMLSFTIADGALPSNEGRGYVLRRILRRAVRYGRMLGFHEPFLYRLVPTLSEVMGSAFPEIVERREHIERVIHAEEESFGQTLDRGLEIFEQVAARIGASGSRDFPGDEAFRLYDTFGFPLDLTELLASERGLHVDTDRFNVLMTEQRERARAAGRFAVNLEDVARWQTVSEGEHSQFTGYDSLAEEAQIREVRVVEREQDKAYHVVLDRTPFYGESGGQIGDTGTLTAGSDVIRVLDTQKEGERIVHTIDHLPEDLMQRVVAEVDETRRRATMRAHSATHLLHEGLRRQLGTHVAQAGSLVAPDRLRFDFSHYEGVPRAALDEVEAFVNEQVLDNLPVRIAHMGLDEAKGKGAMALFGEKYGEVVRTVGMGEVSLELCGGTHVPSTAAVGPVKILREQSIAAGVRRIEAITGKAAYAFFRDADATLDEVGSLVGARRREEVTDRIERFLQDAKRLEQDAAQLRQQAALSQMDTYVQQAQDVKGVRVVASVVQGIDRDELRGLLDAVRGKLGSGVVVLGAEVDGKPAFVAGVSQDLIANRGLKAGDIAGAVAKIAGGGGGGRPDMAQAGGRDPSKLVEAVAAVVDIVSERVS
ncbi:alanine--tRNA ligase [Candidatus Poribacteria bacterium]|nr:alanine--tRNA ligase [Candidatus Poribacteria bacterium]